MKNYVDWNQHAQWDDNKPPSAVLNELFRISQEDDQLSTEMINTIKQYRPFVLSALCKYILYNDKYDRLFGDVPPNLIQIGQLFDYYLDACMNGTTESVWHRVCKLNINRYYYDEQIKGKKSYAKSYSLPDLERDNLDSLQRFSSPTGLIGILIYAREFISSDYLRAILQELNDGGIIDTTSFVLSPLYLSFDRTIFDEALLRLGTYGTIGDILRLSCVNRRWHDLIAKAQFIKNCHTFKKINVTDTVVELWDEHHSSWWYFNELKMLTITASKDTLFHSKFPLINAKNVEYLNGNIYWLTEPPTNLKGLKIQCMDLGFTNVDAEQWMHLNNDTKPIKLTVIVGDHDCRMDEIPNSQAVLWETCYVRVSNVVDCLQKPDTQWVALQSCISTLPSRFVNPDPKANYDNYVPNKTLCFNYSSRVMDLWMLLQSDGTYEKYISKLIILSEFDAIDMDLPKFLQYISKIKNTNTAKYISMLWHADIKYTKELPDEYVEKQSLIFDYCKDNVTNIFFNEAIATFKFGLINTYNNNKRANVFDLKKLFTRKQIKKQEKIWDKILFTNKFVDGVSEWEAEYNEMIKSMP